MKKIAIVTITDNENFGNRLQNFALSKTVENLNYNVSTIWLKEKFIRLFLRKGKRALVYFFSLFSKKYKYKIKDYARQRKFKIFTDSKLNNSFYSKKNINKINIDFDQVIIGSDQIWNPKVVLLNNLGVKKYSIPTSSYAASFGVSYISENMQETYKNALENLDKISVRELQGKEIIENICGRKDIEIVLDPTLLLEKDEWSKLAKKPKNLSTNKYILTYFLGEISNERKNEIYDFAEKNKCAVINILDRDDSNYICGPEEFIYLEKNAFLICTDSFHSCLFSIIFNRPFVVFDREDKKENMSSRIENMLKMFKLEDRKYKGSISDDDKVCDYTYTYNVINEKREKSLEFLKNSLKK